MRNIKRKLSYLTVFLFLVSCGGGGSSSSPLVLTFASSGVFKLDENSSGSWEISASSNKNTAITYSIGGGSDTSSFSLSGNTLSFLGSGNYEAPTDANKDGVYEVNIQASSGNTSATQSITVQLTDVAEAPVILSSSISNIEENNITIGTIEALDEDANSSITFSLADSQGAKDEDLLTIDSSTGAISFISAPDYESPNDYNSDNTVEFTVVVSDGALSTSSDISFSILDGNDAPVITTKYLSDLNEGALTIGTIAAVDPEGATLTYSLVDSSGSKDEALLSINSTTGEVSFLIAPDYESPADNLQNNTIVFSVAVSDGVLTSQADYHLYIVDVNEAPVIQGNIFRIAEGTTRVGGFVVTDDDSDYTHTYAFGNPANYDIFSIDSQTGVVSFLSAPDFENPTDDGFDNTHYFTLAISDGNITTNTNFQVIVADVNEAPSFSINSSQVFVENTTTILNVGVTDPEGASITYSLSGNDASKFSISSRGGLTFNASPDFEAPSDYGSNNVYDVSVSASDGANTSTISMVISILDSTADNYGIALPNNVALAELKKENE
tara:strand:- start:3036 stop:4700 length:1665 start_codon:yes stop_codon:yes gene_type:complete